LVFVILILMLYFCCRCVQCIYVEPTAWFFAAYHSRAAEIASDTCRKVCCH